MKFKCLGTGSSGNCYLIQLGDDNILLDAGVSIKKIIKNINLNNLAFAFISHEHLDHSKSLQNLRFSGVECIEGTNIQSFTKISINDKIDTKMSVWCFPVKHGDTKNSGIIIKNHNECILYVTDFTICDYDLFDFKFTSVIVECNYLTRKVIQNGELIRTKENIYRHLSLKGCELFLSKLNLTKCKEIILVHFSDDYSEPIYMGCYINDRFGIKTLCCKKNGGYDTYE